MIDWVVDVGLDSKVSAIERRVFNLTSIHMRTHTGAQRRAGALIRADRRPSGYLPFIARIRNEELDETAAVTPRAAANILSSQVTVWNSQALGRLDQSEWELQQDSGDRAENLITEICEAVIDILIKDDLTPEEEALVVQRSTDAEEL
jgi:hypothetical protein